MIKALSAAALVAIATPAPTPAYAEPGDNADVRAAAKAFDDAQLHGDRAALERLLAPDYLFVRGSGRVGDRRDFIAGFTAAGQKLEPFTILDPLFMRVTGDVAIVGGEAWIKGTDGGKPFTEHFRYSDVFARRDGHWVAVYTQVTGLPGK
jgi:ketosteroid isomerase-like protein